MTAWERQQALALARSILAFFGLGLALLVALEAAGGAGTIDWLRVQALGPEIGLCAAVLGAARWSTDVERSGESEAFRAAGGHPLRLLGPVGLNALAAAAVLAAWPSPRGPADPTVAWLEPAGAFVATRAGPAEPWSTVGVVRTAEGWAPFGPRTSVRVPSVGGDADAAFAGPAPSTRPPAGPPAAVVALAALFAVPLAGARPRRLRSSGLARGGRLTFAALAGVEVAAALARMPGATAGAIEAVGGAALAVAAGFAWWRSVGRGRVRGPRSA